MEKTLNKSRIDLAAAYRLADMYKLSEGICNHLTLTLPTDPDRFLVVSYGTHWSQVKASNLMIVNNKGTVIEGDGIVEDTAFYIHARVHAERPDLKCLMHTHQPYTLSIAMTENGRLIPASQNSLRFYGRIAYDNEYNGLALGSDEGDRIVKALGKKNILLMANHGVLVGGETVAKTFDDLYYLERAAMAQVLASSTGQRLKTVSEKIASDTANQIQSSNSFALEHFEAMKRVLDKTQPEYKE
ncbi:MAG: hypothetical protein CL567_03700 [Alphaproteobacteria bacterium]|nr:hypothetical protein [Alphaproteobacteria bacterium]